MDRTVLHGIDESAPSLSKFPARGNMGSRCYDEASRTQRVWDSTAKAWLPLEYVAFQYDFAVHGGVQGTINLKTAVPAGTIILDGLLDVITQPTSDGSATVAISVEGANDVYAAGAISGLTPGLKDVVPDGTAGKAIKTTQARNVTLTIAVAALTAGKIRGFLRCLRSQST
jgi:hypothetical protein